MSENTKIYVTRYALTAGIHTEYGLTVRVDGYATGRNPEGYFVAYSKNDYALTLEDAAKQAEKKRSKKIASLQMQIAKLEKLTFTTESIR